MPILHHSKFHRPCFLFALFFASFLPVGRCWAAPTVQWSQIRGVPMTGDLKVFWNVSGGDDFTNFAEAERHGFQLVDLLNTYADYPGQQQENINTFLETNRANPWNKPEYFERVIHRNINQMNAKGALFIHDIEFEFEQNFDKAWADPVVRATFGTRNKAQFSKAYIAQWASWLALPCEWAKQAYPKEPVGIYGVQPFHRDYWGLAGQSAKQIDGTHILDGELWKYLDPVVDFYTASVYVFYDDPGSIYYIASNIEENVQRTRKYGNKPVYAYEWLRYHSSNPQLGERELAPYLVEAMAVLPYFSGARGLVLWGWEPKTKGQYYQTLPLFMNSLGRVSDLASKISKAELIIDKPANVLWKDKQPLVRKLKVSPSEWIILAINPWQNDHSACKVQVACGKQQLTLALAGRHTYIFHHVAGRPLEKISM